MSWEDYREFELVYRENARLVYRFLVSRGCPPQEAEDTVIVITTITGLSDLSDILDRRKG